MSVDETGAVMFMAVGIIFIVFVVYLVQEFTFGAMSFLEVLAIFLFIAFLMWIF